MSTRGCVAVGTTRKWRGLYNHSDSYPTGLGSELWDHLMQEQLAGRTLAEIGEAILQFDDWRNYLKGGICEFCGKLAEQPHTISGSIYGKANQNSGDPFPDPGALHHEHNDLNSNNFMTNVTADALFIEWVYVIDPGANAVHVSWNS
jgi:hypothetical protein